jgi:PAS domain S-box-containing protein
MRGDKQPIARTQRLARTPQRERPHTVQFYEADAFLVDAVTRFIGGALGTGEVAVSIATPQHRARFEAQLRARAIDVAAAAAQGRYVTLDAAETLATFMVDGRPDEDRFTDVIGGPIGRLVAAYPGAVVHAFGEMVALLAADGNHAAAIQLEELWNRLAQRMGFSLLCAYPLRTFRSDDASAAFGKITAAHTHVVPAESYTALASDDDRLRVVTHLQQKATALDTVAAERKHAESALRERNAMLQALVAASPTPIVVIDVDKTVRLWNPAAERVFGWSEHEVVGHEIPIVPPEKLDECDGVRDAVTHGESFAGIETHRFRRDGAPVDVRISAAPLSDDEGTVRSMVLLFEDVTQRNRAESARQSAVRELHTLHDLGRTLSAELDLQRLLQVLTDTATQLSGAEFGAFFYNAFDDNAPGDRGGHYLLYAVSGSSREAFERFGPPRNTKMFAPTFAGEAVVRLDDVTKDPRYVQSTPRPDVLAAHLPVRSYLAVPVVGRNGNVFGGLFLAHPQPSVFTEESERIVTGLASHAAVAIENARLYDAERRARTEAEAANRAKDEFLAMLGHELRNPLAAVRNAIVAARVGGARRERALDIARRQSEHLGRLVDDLLDVARISQGKITLHVQRVRCAAIVERALETTRPLIAERGHLLTITLPRHDVQVEGDATRLEQVLVNLITNAAKYTPPGGRIEVMAERDDAELVLRVRDDGAGIAPEVLPRVFDLFMQGDRALDRAPGGLGIGLTVVRKLVELHGGRVEAHSAGLGRGAEFVVRVPALPEETANAGESTPPTASPTVARVLIVEDHPDVAESLQLLMEVLGHQVRIVHDGESAVRAAQASPPDVMLVDIGLPGMNGYEVARRVRDDPKLARVVLVALTGYGRDEDREAAHRAGFDHHLAKPVEPDALHALVTRITPLEPSQSLATIH